MARSYPPSAKVGNRPIHTPRHRNIKLTIWKNTMAKGPMYDVKATRSYKEGEDWGDSQSFGFNDLLVVAKLMMDAHTFITAQREQDPRPAHPPPRRTSHRDGEQV